MNDLIRKEPCIEQVARFQALQSGQYWRALRSIPEEGIDEGTVLLIRSIRWVDEAPHTVILRPHPGKIGTATYLDVPQEDGTTSRKYFRFDEHRFLLNDFLSLFEFEPDHQRVRGNELREIQGRIDSLQNELLEGQSDPSIMARVVEAGLIEQEEMKQGEDVASDQQPALPMEAASPRALVSLATGTVAGAIEAGITAGGIASLKEAALREHEVATIKSKWIQGKTGAIAAAISAMTPFYEEQAAAALAQTEDVRSYVARLMQGIESLDLYVGKGVEVTTIRTGDTAPKDEPLGFVQKKLMMDEELAVWVDVDEWFDFSKEDKFFDALREHDSLVNQIFPTQRCMLVMAVTRRDIEYGDTYSNIVNNNENKKVFLLVRDGMNVHRVVSPVESHLGAERLFPSRDEQDRVFRGLDGSQIKFEDVAYADKVAAHDKFALHYKRFLLLVCGLDHRLKLFGDFYDGPQSLHFVSMEFQEKYCRFIHDDDGAGMLPRETRAPLQEWIEEKNAYLRSGSRVLCNWHPVMNPSTAPGACKYEVRGDRFYRRYVPGDPMEVAIAYRDGHSICVEAQVSGHSRRYEKRTFSCKVNLSKFKNGDWDYTDLPFLCLDAVGPKELHWYIHNRGTRRDHLSYIRFFKHALKHIEHELAEEGDTRGRLVVALAEGAIAFGDEAKGVVDQAVVAWRAANRGKPLPRFENGIAPAAWKSLLDQMYMLAGEGRRRATEIESFVRELGYEPLRLVLSGGAKLVVYAAPRHEERDDRLEDHAWIHRITVERGKSKWLEKSRRWVLLPKSAASETTLHQWDEVCQWAGRNSAFPSYERKREILATASRFAERLSPFTRTMSAGQHLLQMDAWERARAELLRGAKYVTNPWLAVPFGMVYYPKNGMLNYLCVGSWTPHGLLYRLAPNDAARKGIQDSFVRPYAKKDRARQEFAAAADDQSGWSLMEVSVALSDAHGVFSHRGIGVEGESLDGRSPADPLLAPWFDKGLAAVKKHGRVWLADGVMDEHGRLVLDDLLGIARPTGFDPVRVLEITLRPNDDTILKFTRWFDICRGDGEERSPHAFSDETNRLVEGVLPEGAGGWSCSTSHHGSPEEARAFIARQRTDTDGAACTSVCAADLSAAPRPPEGVERWYVVRNGS